MQTLLYFYEIVNKYSAWIEAPLQQTAGSFNSVSLVKNVPAKDVSGRIRVSMLFSGLMDAAAHRCHPARSCGFSVARAEQQDC